MIRSRSLRTRALACGAVAVALTLAACGDDDSGGDAADTTAAAATTAAGSTAAGSTAAAPSADEVKQIFADAGYDWSDVDLSNVKVNIGQLIPRSGDFSFLGDAMLGGAQLAAEQVRQAGGPELVFKTEDIGPGDPEMSTAGARRLVSEDVPVIQSSFGPATLAVVPIVEQSKTLLFQTAGATADQLGVSDYLWMGRPTATDPFPGLADYVIQEEPDVKKAAIMVWNEGSAIKSADLIRNRWEESGREIALQELVEVGASDMGPSAARVAGSDAGAVFLITFGADTSTALNALRDAGFKGSVLGVDWNPGVTEATNGGDEGYKYVTDAQDATLDNPFAQLYLSGYPAKTGAPIDVFSALFWDNTVHIAELIARVVRDGGDPTDSTAIIEALKSDPHMPSSSVGTPVGWDVTTKAQTLKPHGFYEIQGGKPVMTGLVENGKLELGKSLADAGS